MSKRKPAVDAGPTDAELTLDTVHQLLSARRRRYALYCLYLYENPVRLADVADRVTEWEQDGTSVPEDRLRMYTNLYHVHVPKLDDAGVVAYQQDEDVVELAANAARLRPHLEQTAETDLDGENTLRP